jgi:threonine dehydratase
MISLSRLEKAAATVYRAMPPTLQYVWPLLAERAGCTVWVKHENHTPIGAFKLRGGLVLMDQRVKAGRTAGVISATRGNHGQSLAWAGRRLGVAVTIVAPRGNSPEKNAAMAALGAQLIEAGDDFDAARKAAQELAQTRGLDMIAPFDPLLVAGVATYARELFAAASALDAVYVPIGMGSGICGMIAVRDLLGLKTRVIGVVSRRAAAYARSFTAGRVVETASADNTFADGMAVRAPSPEALAIILKGAERIVEVDDGEIAAAIRLYFQATHNIAEGAGAATLAALLQERDKMRGKSVALVLSGGNIDLDVFAKLLREDENHG